MQPNARAMHAAEPAPTSLLALGPDAHRLISALLDNADLPSLRAVCRALRAQSRPPPRALPRAAMLRTPQLVAYAWDLRGFRSPTFPRGEQRRLFRNAARVGNVAVLAWLRGRRCAWDAETCAAAAEGGHQLALRWARERGCAWDARTCSAAAAGGHLAVLQWARAHGCEWDDRVSLAAAQNGHLDVLQWAARYTAGWQHQFTCFIAAQRGHVAVLRWAVENGCPWDPERCAYVAASGGHDRVVEWINADTD